MEFYKLNDHRDNRTCHKGDTLLTNEEIIWLLHVSSGNGSSFLDTTVWRMSAGPSVMLAEFAKNTPKEAEDALSRGRVRMVAHR